jgi:hypothetical protein
MYTMTYIMSMVSYFHVTAMDMDTDRRAWASLLRWTLPQGRSSMALPRRRRANVMASPKHATGDGA